MSGEVRLGDSCITSAVAVLSSIIVVSSRLQNRCLKVMQISMCFDSFHCPFVTALLMFCLESSQSIEHLLCDPLPYQTRDNLERFLGEYRQDIRLPKEIIGWESWHSYFIIIFNF